MTERLTVRRALDDVHRWTLASVRRALARIEADEPDPAAQLRELRIWLDEATRGEGVSDAVGD